MATTTEKAAAAAELKQEWRQRMVPAGALHGVCDTLREICREELLTYLRADGKHVAYVRWRILSLYELAAERGELSVFDVAWEEIERQLRQAACSRCGVRLPSLKQKGLCVRCAEEVDRAPA